MEQKKPDFLDAEPGIVLDGLPDLSEYLFIHSSLDDAGLDPYEFRIFCHLRRRAKDRTAWPGMRSISQVTGISLNKVCLTIKSLSDKGFIAVQKRPNRSNLYLIQSPKERSSQEQGVLVKNGGVPDKNGGVPVVVHKGIQGRVSNEGNPIKDHYARVRACAPAPACARVNGVFDGQRMNAEFARELEKEYGDLVYEENKPFMNWCKENNRAPTVVRFKFWLDNRQNDAFQKIQKSSDYSRPIQSPPAA